VRTKIRLKHYSIRTKQAYMEWIRRFIMFHDKALPFGRLDDHDLHPRYQSGRSGRDQPLGYDLKTNPLQRLTFPTHRLQHSTYIQPKRRV
jgi:hypothetical protein